MWSRWRNKMQHVLLANLVRQVRHLCRARGPYQSSPYRRAIHPLGARQILGPSRRSQACPDSSWHKPRNRQMFWYPCLRAQPIHLENSHPWWWVINLSRGHRGVCRGEVRSSKAPQTQTKSCCHQWGPLLRTDAQYCHLHRLCYQSQRRHQCSRLIF